MASCVLTALCGCCLLLLVSAIQSADAAVSLHNCGGSSEDKVAEVVRGSDNTTFNCSADPSTSSLEWRVLYPTATDFGDFGAGVCPSPAQDGNDTCYAKALFPAFIPRRTTAAYCLMTVNPTAMNNEILLTNSTLVCKDNNIYNEDRCAIDYIVPGSGTCSVQFDTVTSPWSVNSSCVITQGNSTLSRYACRWYQRKDGSSDRISRSGWIVMTSNTLPTGRATCVARFNMPTAEGRYSYDVNVRPGRQFITTNFIGGNQIATPVSPTVTGCSPDVYIAEKTAVSCTCRTDSVGQPAGRLLWYRDGVLVETGNHGDSILTLSQTLTRGDHNTTQFRCDVNWAVDVMGENVTFKVGYKPESLSFQLNASTEMTVTENATVTLTCQADGRPVAVMTVVRQGGSEVSRGQSPLTFDLKATCNDTASYLCSASNIIGQATTTASVRLFVRCPPGSSSTDLSTLNFVSQPVSTQFDVVAYPALEDTFSFRFLGPKGLCRCSADLPIEDIQLSAVCRAKDDTDHVFVCTVTVHNVSSPEAEGVYSVTISNAEGSRDYTFEVELNDGSVLSTRECPPNYAVAAVALAVVLALMMVAIIVILVVSRRRQWLLPWAREVYTSRDGTTSKRESSAEDLYLQPVVTPEEVTGSIVCTVFKSLVVVAVVVIVAVVVVN